MVVKKSLPRGCGGFTLIELLVVISVIGILVSVLAVSFTTAQKRGRDTKRRGDLQAIQKSLEQCYVLNSQYPAAGAVVSGSPLACTQTTMNQVSYDPKNSDPYFYTYSVAGDQSEYCLCGVLEQTGSGNATQVGANGSCNLGSGDYQCLSNQQ
ncbi:MAG: prepilin-type N-terminal cleavage/methylation domain-containing protein [Patescibacteria group bacterium]|nr:prepilin-type N-terminal cleavage/methylation domain-containing protein [Patescibacteria group bacterium]MDZ4228629.1 prepilin-type N-terminal cleavage/methylation domain-containing protein [Patescibacteria group bacterium]